MTPRVPNPIDRLGLGLRHRRQFGLGHRPPRSGVTLLELTAVVALLAALFAMAWPSFSSQLADGRLRSSGEQVRELMRSARRSAIADQRTYRCDLAQPAAKLRMVAASLPLDGDPSATTAATELESLLPGQNAPWSEELELTPPIRLVRARQLPDLLRESAAEPEPIESQTDRDMAWRRFATFYPDGTSDGGELVLMDARGKLLVVHLEAATGDARLSTIFDEQDLTQAQDGIVEP